MNNDRPLIETLITRRIDAAHGAMLTLLRCPSNENYDRVTMALLDLSNLADELAPDDVDDDECW